MPRRVLAAALVAASLASTAAVAQPQNTGLYVNVFAGQQEQSYTTPTPPAAVGGSFDANVFGGRLGYGFTDFWAVELEASAGGTGSRVGTFKTNVNGNLGVYGVGRLPVGDHFNLIGRLGYQQTSLSATSGAVRAEDEQGSFALGVGAELMLYGPHGVRFDYTSVASGEDSDTLSFSYVLKF